MEKQENREKRDNFMNNQLSVNTKNQPVESPITKTSNDMFETMSFFIIFHHTHNDMQAMIQLHGFHFFLKPLNFLYPLKL